jgi:Holliday junction resolvase-like predicted endonuclease
LENKVKGKLGEALAKKHLEFIGIKIIKENYRYKWGKIDLFGISTNY